MFEKFTSEARAAVILAQEEAATLSHDWVGPEHILLGLIRAGEGAAAEVLQSQEIGIEAAREQVVTIVGRGQGDPSRRISFSLRAKKVLEISQEEEQHLDHGSIGTGHILLALMRSYEDGSENVARLVLTRLGANLNWIHQQLLVVLRRHDGKESVNPEHVTQAMEDLVEILIQSLENEIITEEQMSLISGHFLDALPVSGPEEMARELERLSDSYPIVSAVYRRHLERWPLLEALSTIRDEKRSAIAAFDFGRAFDLRTQEKEILKKVHELSPLGFGNDQAQGNHG